MQLNLKCDINTEQMANDINDSVGRDVETEMSVAAWIDGNNPGALKDILVAGIVQAISEGY